ncbi:MAG: hypothetical protein QF613_07565 [Candidatus Marinimicrobia bacterium]|nr:hypothetical protein [Candidatus Neomarinimicrobiota bacterium]MDP6594040.1 hypothetical protein [Candidatus Neomarinimicrobiota bacterium]MDP6836711.1 hypothetical protein [Candidatus Neomarinimicrobiota bacterium]MDP6966661.1 hypothetical protein [Candidatus Neomarinimicrobiota bacterium]
MRPRILLLFILLRLLSGQEYPPPTNLVTIPTAGGLVRGTFSADMRVQSEGGLTAGLAVGITDRFMFGLSYGASRLIGHDKPIAFPRPEVIMKYRLVDEAVTMPGIALGLDTQGFGTYNDADSLKRYAVKAYGAYLACSKNWRSPFGNVGAHIGANYNFTEQLDGDDDASGFVGFDIEVNPELSFLFEWNAALNENDMTAKTLALSKGGYLNAAIRWTFVEHLHIELDFNNLLFDEEKVGYVNRELKVTYIEYF